MPVIHQSLVLEEILTDVGQVVGEGLAPGKQLPKTTQARIQRMAPGIDDLCLGQDQMDESHRREIVGHLVDEAGRALGAVHLCGAKVFPAQRLQVFRPQFPDRLGIVHAIGTIEIERTRHVSHVGQFGGSFHLTVTGQDLLDQGGA